MLSTLVIEPVDKHTATVIWLHGLGDTGKNWTFFVEELQPRFPFIKWILPNAPLRKMTCLKDPNFVSAWINVSTLDHNKHIGTNEDGIEQSTVQVEQLIQHEIKSTRIPSDRIILGGFSQGAVISLLVAVTTSFQLGGVIGCSGWLPLRDKLDEFGSAMNKKIPLLICHGEKDIIINYKHGRDSAKYLQHKGYKVQFESYPVEHAFDSKETDDIAIFINAQLKCFSMESQL